MLVSYVTQKEYAEIKIKCDCGWRGKNKDLGKIEFLNQKFGLCEEWLSMEVCPECGSDRFLQNEKHLE